MMDEQEIKAIIATQGYSMYTNDHIGSKGNGKVTTYVYAMKGRAKCCLGNMRKVAAMNAEQLRAHVATKFAQSPAQKAREGSAHKEAH